jgi:hypothetical protein
MDLFYRKHYAPRYNPIVNATVLLAIYAGLVAAIGRLLVTPAERRRVSV